MHIKISKILQHLLNLDEVFKLSGNCLNSNDSCIDTCGCETNFDVQKKNLLNKTGSNKFKVENFEVFQVI